MFSSRTAWQRELNRLALAYQDHKSRGQGILDLTASNPTACGLTYPEGEILQSLSTPRILRYRPEPKGRLGARRAVCAYYHRKGVRVTPEQVILTPGTSESYSMLFTLLCDPAEEIMVPRPSYPLFEYVARMRDVRLVPYRFTFGDEWCLDPASLEEAAGNHTRAIAVVTPHNPTGAYLKRSEMDVLVGAVRSRSLALVVDEVFADYPLSSDDRRCSSTAAEERVLTFTLNGLSKAAGLPQLKLGWIVVSGPVGERREALERLGIISDTYLNVNTPVQEALPALMRASKGVRRAIGARLRENQEALRSLLRDSAVTALPVEGGWYAVLRLPRTRSDEEWALTLLTNAGVYLYPGYFFDFDAEGYAVVSLLTPANTFRRGIHALAEHVRGSVYTPGLSPPKARLRNRTNGRRRA